MRNVASSSIHKSHFPPIEIDIVNILSYHSIGIELLFVTEMVSLSCHLKG